MLLYGAVKFVAYVTWCYLGIKWLSDEATPFPLAVGLGTIRWFLGLVFGFILFFTVQVSSREEAGQTYFFVYSLVRVVEWGFIALIIGVRAREQSSFSLPQTVLWVFLGILLSFGTDLLSPDGMAGRFCLGRCLCFQQFSVWNVARLVSSRVCPFLPLTLENQ
ncbi:MAG: hypothetical protein K1Y36_10950 [Blastocatellia bacterium]|nr:hypothetical protein [Blastocatellia bacterium]